MTGIIKDDKDCTKFKFSILSELEMVKHPASDHSPAGWTGGRRPQSVVIFTLKMINGAIVLISMFPFILIP
jgi:hypothetical protein